MKLISTFVLLCWLAGGVFAQAPQQAIIHPALTDQMQARPNDFLPVYLLLAEQVDVAAMDADFTKRHVPMPQRVPQIIQSLQTKARQTQGPVLSALQSLSGVNAGSIQAYWITNVIYAEMNAAAIIQISQRPELELIEYVAPPEPSSVTSQTAVATPNGRENGLTAINAPAMWNLGYTGYGRKVLIMDTGVDFPHPALNRNYYGNFVDGHLAWFDQTGTSTVPYDCDSHGTHVCGTTVGLNPNTHDTIGVAFNGLWMGAPEIPGFDPSCIALFNPAGVFQWALNPDGDLNTTEDMPDVINNSWRTQIAGAPANFCNNGAFAQMQITIEAAGIIAVFGAGNEGPGGSTMGAEPSLNMSLVNNFAVGSINGNSATYPISGFSSRGPSHCFNADTALYIKPEVVAPGSNVRSSIPGGGYAAFSGTSMATPHVSGAFLLLREAFPTLSAYDLKMALYMSAIDLGAPGEDNNFGNGLIDVKAAYDYLVNQGYSPVIPNRNHDLAIKQIINLDEINCVGTLQAIVAIENRGDSTISEAEIGIYFSTGYSDTISWTGTLFPSGIQPVLVPVQTFSSGGYSLEVKILSVNQTEDYFFLDNQTSFSFQVLGETIDFDPALVVCPGGNTVLHATPSTGTIAWYDAASGGNLLGIGNSLTTPPINTNTTYYAIIEQLGNGGKLTYVGDNGFTDPSTGQGLTFDALSTFTLKSVMVLCQGDGLRTIELRDQGGTVIQSKDIFIGLGPRVLDLDFLVPAGNDYELVLTGPGNLFISNDNISYPYVTPGLLSIKGSSLDQGSDVFYPYFYDWKVSAPSMCVREPITVQVGSDTLTAAFAASATQITMPWTTEITFTDQTPNATNWLWNFGDGTTSNLQNPVHSYALVDTYQVSLTATNASGCTDIVSQTIEVRGFNTAIDPQQIYQDGLQVFPNPGTGTFYLTINYAANEQGLLKLFDAQGRIVLQGQYQLSSQSATPLHLGHLPAGVYTVLWQGKNQTIAQKIMKQ